jgi:hypothetical protein
MDECKQCQELTQQITWFSFSLGAMSTLALEAGAGIGNVQTLMRMAFQQSPINENWSPTGETDESQRPG